MRYVALAFRDKEALLRDWSWVRPADVIVTDQYIAVMGAPDLSAFRKSADAISNAVDKVPAAMFSLTAKTVLSATAKVAGKAFDKTFGEQNEYSSDFLNTTFDAGRLIYCDLRELDCGYVSRKGFFSTDRYFFVSGKFNHVAGALEVKFYLGGVEEASELVNAVDCLKTLGVSFADCGPIPDNRGVFITVAPQDRDFPYSTTPD